MTPVDAILIGVMLVMILVMVYYLSKLIKDDPELWSAARSKETWQNMWKFGEKLQPKENTPILEPIPEEEEESPVEAEE